MSRDRVTRFTAKRTEQTVAVTMDENQVPTDIIGLFTYMKGRFDGLEDSQKEGFEEINRKLEAHDEKFEALDHRMNREKAENDARFTAIEEKQKDVDDLLEKVDNLQKKVLFSELKSKKQNVIVFKMPQTDVNEKPEDSMLKVDTFLYNILQIPNNITILEAHRLRRKDKNKKGPLPLIFKLLHVGDKSLMKQNLKNLSEYNEGKEKSEVVSVEFDHYPEVFKQHKDLLKDAFYKAKKKGLKPRWFVDFDQAQLCLKAGTKTLRPTM